MAATIDGDVKVIKQISYEDLLKKVAEKYATPVKQLDETIEQFTDVLGDVLRDTRPSKINQAVQVETPLGLFRSRRVPQESRTDIDTNEKFDRNECILISVSASIRIIDAANQGLVVVADDLSKGTKADKKEKKSA
jgi:hypothetical protein